MRRAARSRSAAASAATVTDWVVRATGRIRSLVDSGSADSQWSPKVEPPPQVGRAEILSRPRREGHTFGPAFQGVETLWYADGTSLGKITFPPSVIDTTAYILHPAQLDSCLQVIRGFRDFGATARSGATMAIPSGSTAYGCIASRRTARYSPGPKRWERPTKNHCQHYGVRRDRPACRNHRRLPLPARRAGRSSNGRTAPRNSIASVGSALPAIGKPQSPRSDWLC